MPKGGPPEPGKRRVEKGALRLLHGTREKTEAGEERVSFAAAAASPRGFITAGPADGPGRGFSPLWVFSLPDRIRAGIPVLYDPRFSSSSPPVPRETVRVGGFQPETKHFDQSGPTTLLNFEQNCFFVQAVLPLADTASNAGTEAECGIVLWARIDRLTALQVAHKLSGTPPQPPLRPLPKTFFGSCANLLPLRSEPCGLFSLLELTWDHRSTIPVVSAVEDTGSPFPGLADLLAHVDDPQAILGELARRSPADEQLKLFEDMLLERNTGGAQEILFQSISAWKYDARAQYAAGCLFDMLEQPVESARFYHRAQLLDHPDGFPGELAAKNAAARPFRERYPQIFEQIRRGERLRALTPLRQAAQLHPLIGNAILAYCLRGAGLAEEGLQACRKSLELDPLQADVLGTEWSFHVELKDDEAALDCALRHLTEYPQDLSANINVIDSLLLQQAAESALLFAHRYFIFSDSTQIAVKHFFKTYEACGLFREAADLFDQLIPLISGPTPDTLSCYGETLIEANRLDEALRVFEQALLIEPGNAKVVLGYARGLARTDREAEAMQLLSTVLADKNRVDRPHDRALLVTLLAEIQRRTGQPALALQTFADHFPEGVTAHAAKIGALPLIEYADVLISCGQTGEAKAVLLTVIHDFPGEQAAHALLDFLNGQQK